MTATPRGDLGVIQTYQRAALLPDLVLGQRCPCCYAWHGVPPLAHLKPGDRCPHDPQRQCRSCGQPVGALSVGGPDVCVRCDIGHAPRKEPEMGGTETAAPSPKPGRGTLTKHAELTATSKLVALLEPLSAEARKRVLDHATAILKEPTAPEAPPPTPE